MLTINDNPKNLGNRLGNLIKEKKIKYKKGQ